MLTEIFDMLKLLEWGFKLFKKFYAPPLPNPNYEDTKENNINSMCSYQIEIADRTRMYWKMFNNKITR